MVELICVNCPDRFGCSKSQRCSAGHRWTDSRCGRCRQFAHHLTLTRRCSGAPEPILIDYASSAPAMREEANDG